MKKFQIGNIVKNKKGDNCIILDIKGDRALIFNLDEMEPQGIELTDISKKVGDANCTTTVIDGKKIVRKKDEKESKEIEDDSMDEKTDDENKEKTEKEKTEKEETKEIENISDAFGELMKLFGKAAIEIGNILVNATEAESDEDDNKRR